MEECHVTLDNIDDLKQLFGGEEFYINVKTKRPYLLERCPCLVTCNEFQPKFCNGSDVAALKDRMIVFSFHCKAEPSPKLFDSCDLARYFRHVKKAESR